MRDIAKDKELCQKATSGPWVVSGKYVVQDRYDRDDFRQAIFKAEHIPKLEHDKRFAAEAREALPYYIEQVEQLQAEIAKLRLELLERDEWPLVVENYKLRAVRDRLRKRVEELEAVAVNVKNAGFHNARHEIQCNCCMCELYEALAALEDTNGKTSS